MAQCLCGGTRSAPTRCAHQSVSGQGQGPHAICVADSGAGQLGDHSRVTLRLPFRRRAPPLLHRSRRLHGIEEEGLISNFRIALANIRVPPHGAASHRCGALKRK